MNRARISWAIAVIDLAIFIPTSLIDPGPDYGAIVLYILGIGAYVGIGALLVTRVPTNPIGALMLTTGTLAVAAGAIGTYADLGALQDPAWPGAALARTIGDAMFIYPLVVAIVGIPLVFPDGHLPSRRFRWVIALTTAGMTAWTINVVFGAGLDVIVLISMPVAFGGAMAAVSLRFRHGDPVQRQQVKWLAADVIVGATAVLAGLFLFNFFPDLANGMIIVGILALFAMPFVIGIAILRYRLYEIDRLISRTIAYAVVTGVLVATFGLIVLVLSTALTSVTQGQTVAVAASTLAVFALFQPVLRRVRRAVDRRFDRARYDGQRLADAFAGRLRDEVDITTVTADLDATVRAAVRPTTLGLWVRGSGGPRP
jgi:hypothetical protein